MSSPLSKLELQKMRWCHQDHCRHRLRGPGLGEDPTIVQKILAHLDDNATSAATALLPNCRASPTVGLFD
jgi:hypothetical protein